jgi:hypothetical protein
MWNDLGIAAKKSLEARQKYGGFENVPGTSFHFSYSNGVLNIEDEMVDLWKDRRGELHLDKWV